MPISCPSSEVIVVLGPSLGILFYQYNDFPHPSHRACFYLWLRICFIHIILHPGILRYQEKISVLAGDPSPTMTGLGHGNQDTGVTKSTSRSIMPGVEHDAAYSSSDTTYGTESETPKEVPNGNDTGHDSPELQVPDARQWSLKYKLFVSFSAIISYFFMWVI